MLKRQDNLIKFHFPSFHPDAPEGTHPFLRVGERPAEGADHVIEYLDILGTDTHRPRIDSISSQVQADDDQGGASDDENS